HGAEPAKPLHDAGTHGGRILADAGGKDEGIKAAKGRGKLAGAEPDAVSGIVEGEACVRVAAFVELANVAAQSRKSDQAAGSVQQGLHLFGAHLRLLDKIEHDAGIDL